MKRTLQQKIHLGCKHLGMDDEARRDMQQAVCGKVSMKEMNTAELVAVVQHLEKLGFKPQSNGKKNTGERRAQTYASSMYFGRSWALRAYWKDLIVKV